MTRIEEIYEAMRTEMANLNIDDTPDNRLVFLQGLLDGWKEDEDKSIEKSLYMLALQSEIVLLRVKMTYPKIWEN